MNKERKIFIIDTSVLLYDKFSIESFSDNDVIIPLTVLDELDKFKQKPGLLGEYARHINRFLDSLRDRGNLYEGIRLDNGQTIRVEKNKKNSIPEILDSNVGDNQIIGVAAFVIEEHPDSEVIVVTKDINFRVKCDGLGIKSEDYYKDKIVDDQGQIYSGEMTVTVSNPKLISEFYEKKKILSKNISKNICPNQFVIVKCQQQSFMGISKEEYIVPLVGALNETININAKNKEQKFALELLTRKDIPLVTMTGIAGSGKTFLTLMAGLSGIYDKDYERIIVTRSLQPVGREIGYLPGNIREKMDPWLAPIFDNFRYVFKDSSYFELMQQKGTIEVAPLAFIRGRTFNDAILIVDEAQNSTIHELKTIITRMGENSKIVLIGDVEQIDTHYIDTLSNGLTIVIEKFKKEKLAGHITLLKGERSDLATLASSVI